MINKGVNIILQTRGAKTIKSIIQDNEKPLTNKDVAAILKDKNSIDSSFALKTIDSMVGNGQLMLIRYVDAGVYVVEVK
ncbi:hypothetical protein CHL76_02735 [Marinococcus halophilus]|uniref:Uncharacterized protein n=1 Tax=Marinococcus halophilus TaxID=1371 RepID=A0A510Y1T1_MARHA|nr:hypothetical protein CHL76_02735 [Marinococcus halophilus]GEK57234.1 hypothetical protein MHA01_01390 [Marinococcus halophilus]